MKRGQPLRADPAKTQAWQQRSRDRALARARGRKGLLSSFLRAATAPPPAPKRRVRVPDRTRAEALSRSDGLCVVCQHDLRARGGLPTCENRATQLHHVLPVRTWPEWAKLAVNLVGVCVSCHERHEPAFRRIPRAALHQEIIDFAADHGVDWYIDKTYPT